MPNNNKNLHKANRAKNDEFYTQLSDIEKELSHYREHFKDKVVFCNCDDPQESNFWQYFSLNFEYLGLKKLISTHYETDKPSYKLEIVRDVNEDGKVNGLDTVLTPLKQNGDFRSPECVEILQEADIVVTNPPFSLFREYVAQLMEYEKKFLIVGNQNSLTYKEIFESLKDNKIWLGNTYPKTFIKPDGSNQTFGNVCWFTNLFHKKRGDKLILYKVYVPEEYPKYDNYDAINVDKVKDIPMDYDGYMGVPITFMNVYNPNQFQIFGIMNTGEKNVGIRYQNTEHGRPVVDGKEIYLRYIVKRKDNEN